MNQSKAYVVSVDINSGMNGDTGRGNLVVQSDLTVTIGYLKTGLLLGSAVWQWKQLAVADIGIRLIREDYHLAAPEEVVFPNTDFSLTGPQESMTPKEAAALAGSGRTVPEAARSGPWRRGSWSGCWGSTPCSPTATAPISWRRGPSPGRFPPWTDELPRLTKNPRRKAPGRVS